MKRLKTFLDSLSEAAVILAAAGLVMMTAIIGWQIFGRYVLNNTPNWSERLSIFLMNWYIFLAAAAGVHQKFHLGLVFFREAISGPPRLIAELAAHLVVGGFGLAMIAFGTNLARTTWTHVIPTLGISNGWAYAPVPIAGVLIVIFSAHHIASLFTGSRQETAA